MYIKINFWVQRWGNIILTSIVIADVELIIHDTQVCKILITAKNLTKV